MLDTQITPLVVPAVLWLLIAMSVVTWALLVIKLVQFGRARAQDKRFLRNFWQADSLDQGESVSESNTGPMADTAKAGFAVITGRDIVPGNRDLAQQINKSDRLERVLSQQIERERRAMEGGLAVLASFGSTAPFIGLFGTVWGIMGALVNIGESGSSGLEAVAGPIGHALIATGMGIAVAVPAVLVYNFLVRRLKTSVHYMNDFAHDFFSLAQQSGFQTQGAKLPDHGSSLKSNAKVGAKTEHAAA